MKNSINIIKFIGGKQIMKVVNSKSTKQEILEAYKDAKQKLDEIEAMKDDPVKEEQNLLKQKTLQKADELLFMNILNEDITGKYQSLLDAIALKEQRLKELFDIEAEANTLVAMINAEKDKENELVSKYKTLESVLKEELESKKEELKAQIESLKAERDRALDAINESSDELIADLKIKRQREEEEYAYNLKRVRQKDTDAWEDEKASRENAISLKELEIEETREYLAEKTDYFSGLEEKVAAFPEQLKEATEEGIKKGKADADKSHAFELRTINMKNEYEQKSLAEKIEKLESDLNKEREANIALQEKLDSAYSQMRELATETVQSAGGVKILDRENNK
jgi:hypothetical protein